MQMPNPSFEYAGFQYEIKYDGERIRAFPLSGQHRAASKEKHCRATEGAYALTC